MEGRCPGCQRAYDISDDFLSMGGKAKCPHDKEVADCNDCMVEGDFAHDARREG